MNQAQMINRLSYHKKQVEYYESQILTGLNFKQETRKVTPSERKQVNDICKQEGCLIELLLSGKRGKIYSRTKAKISHHFKNKNYTLERIGFILGVSSHTSIMYLLKKYPENKL